MLVEPFDGFRYNLILVSKSGNTIFSMGTNSFGSPTYNPDSVAGSGPNSILISLISSSESCSCLSEKKSFGSIYFGV